MMDWTTPAQSLPAVFRTIDGPETMWRERLDPPVQAETCRLILIDTGILSRTSLRELKRALKDEDGMWPGVELTDRYWCIRAEDAAINTFLGGLPAAEARDLVLATGQRATRPTSGEDQGSTKGHGARQSLSAGAVVHGFIDDGIAFARGDLIDPASGRHRVTDLWVQGVDSADGQPGPYGLGRMFGSGELDALRASGSEDQAHRALADACGLFGLDEASRPLQWMPVSLQHASHGAMTLDAFSGSSADTVAVPGPVVAVQLPPRLVGLADGSGLMLHVLLGIYRVLEVARQLANHPHRPVPVVINCSFGRYGRPERIEAVLETVAEAMLSAHGPATLVLPAGNHRQAAVQAVLEPDRGSGELTLALPPDNPASTILRLHVSGSGADLAELTVTAPDGTRSPDLADLTNSTRSALVSGMEVLQVSSTTLDGETVVTLAFAPTTNAHGGPRIAAGRWQIKCRFAPGATGLVRAVIGRNGTIGGYRSRGRQSHFLDGNYRVYDPTGHLQTDDTARDPADLLRIRRAGTLNGYATSGGARSGRHVLVVGGYRHSDGQQDRHSGRGDTSGTPDCAAPSRHSPALAGLRARGNRSSARSAIAGTSIAAPIAARRLARLMSEVSHGPDPVDHDAVMARFIGEIRDDEALLATDWPWPDGSPGTTPDPVTGLGRMRAAAPVPTV